MRMSTLITLLVVGGSGLAAFILAYGYLGQQPDPNAGKVPVLSATQPMKRGDAVELGKNAEFKMVHETDLPEEALVEEPKLVADLQQKKVMALQAIGRNDLLKKNTAGSNVSGLIEARLKDKPGFRAVSISVTTDKSVAGFIKPGSYVDLIWSGQIKGGKEVTMALLGNVEVAAVDLENTVNAAQQAQGKEVRYLTFIVSQDDSVRLAFAKEHGNVTAALRGTAGEVAGLKPTKEIDWTSFLSDGKKDPGDAAVSDQEKKSLESEGIALVDMIQSALTSQAAALTAPGPKSVAPITTVSNKQPRKPWYVFELRNVDGKTLSRIPVSSESEFAKKNKHLLRNPEPDELEAINKLAAEQPEAAEGQ
jgi:Flp pilus assembly protein CpaB